MSKHTPVESTASSHRKFVDATLLGDLPFKRGLKNPKKSKKVKKRVTASSAMESAQRAMGIKRNHSSGR